MEIAVVNPQAVLQMYQCKDYPWHSMASPPLAVSAAAAPDNKEKIIATADFNMTSAIARRRLSKRRNPAAAEGWGEGGNGSSSDGSTSNSPTGSLDSLTRHHTRSPITTSTPSHYTHYTNSVNQRQLTDVPTTTHLPTHLSPRTHTHQVLPSHPQATLASTVPLVPATYHFAPSLPVVTAAEQKAFTHPVYTQLQQELNYRYLQDQSDTGSVQHGNRGTAAFSAPHSQASSNFYQQQRSVGVTGNSDSGRSHRVKWCSAHVTIAKQILVHQQQAKNVLELARGSALAAEAAANTSKPITTSAPPTSLDPAHQIALLQMYGVPTTAITGGGYMAMQGMSYPTLPPDIHQLHNLSFVPNTAQTALFMDAANMLSLKPMTTGVPPHQMSDNSTRGVQMVNGVQILPYGPHAAALHHQNLPITAVMPGVGVNSTVNGSYIGHVPVPVIGNCVLNPCQPGVMPAPWVR